MTDRTEIGELLKKRVLLLDGSYGAQFIRRSEREAKAPEILNLEDPDLVSEIHSEYLRAGADFVLTNTFGSTPTKLRSSGIEGHEDIIISAVRIAKDAAGEGAMVLGDIGPTGLLPYPLGEGDFDAFYGDFKETARIMLEEGVDGIILETFSDIQELKAAVLAVRDISSTVFLIAMMTFDENGRSLTGSDPRNFAVTFNDLDVDAVGMNCSLGPEEMIPIFQELSRYSKKLLVVEPNAGLPLMDGKDVIYPVGPVKFSGHMETFLELGANIIGGCCGTGMEHIERLRNLIGDRPPLNRNIQDLPAVTSPTALVQFDRFTVIGERINPSGRKRLRKAMEDGDLKTIIAEARSQIDAGAAVLDVNFGHESSIPMDIIEKAVLTICYNLGTPISLDIQTPDVLERLMRIYPGRPLVNSTSAKPEEMDRKFDLLSRYGGMIIVLAMGNDVPGSTDDRMENMDRALVEMEKHDLVRERVLFDPIVLSLGAGNDPLDTLRALEHLKEKGLLSVCGLSNLSFGLPDRTFYNASFLSMAIERGLTAAIMNPLNATLIGMMKASLVISGRMEIPKADIGEDKGLIKYLLEGSDEEALELAGMMADEKGPLETLEKEIKPAMERIGDLYSKGRIFLPQLILAAQTSRPCFDMMEELLPKGTGKEIFVIATVKGDIHDIGKNIAAAILRSSGFEVVDLGKDVDEYTIVKAVRERNPVALGLSAMMTTTAMRIREVVDALRDEGLDVRVIAGGASLNEKVVADLGADLYAKDPIDALEFLKKLS